MRIDVGDLLKNVGNQAKVKREEAVSFPEDGLAIDGPVRVNVHLVNVGGSILMDGDIGATVTLNCVRCLEDYECPITVAVEEEYNRNPKDLVFPIEENNAIDLTEAIRQNLLTALPIKPLCKKACSGVFQSAAKLLKSADPRLAKLKDLLRK